MPLSPFIAPGVRLQDAERAARHAARLAAAAVRAGRHSADDAFDGLLPRELREVSGHYWSALPVVRRAASWLRTSEARTVVDIGSGAGKFCVAGALLTRCRFIGLEQRASLVTAARVLAGLFEVADRVTFVHGDCDVTTTPVGDAYYLFNPFGEYSFDSARFAEPGVAFSPETYKADVEAVTELLSRAPQGTVVITYNGFGGRLPTGYEQIDVSNGLPGTLRLFRKHQQPS